ncbi:hypothetical protein PGTUg99_022926 [Puccinia graminis f. sp. tritici]|uniref:Uncharacterized protein n=1 Tax=Puccinia graminis f. sp. tritici TaxID=56615 RepID=A0A5B0RFF5_PUCGR|nr:hypothetical protein PGTUg99_022926 [Puccinia graminis f. sp. tritici]
MSNNSNVVEDKTAKTGQVSSTGSAHKGKLLISPAVVPSDWDRSSDAKTKSNKPKAVVSTASPLHKTLTSSNLFKSKQSTDKIVDKLPKSGQLTTTELTSSSKTTNTAKNNIAKTSRTVNRKDISPEVVPSK